jgi:hypothetical protein
LIFEGNGEDRDNDYREKKKHIEIRNNSKESMKKLSLNDIELG